jgi:Zn-dependent protease with chaperone function
MRYFGVPFHSDSEDKIIGGILSFRQLGWIAIPVATLCYCFFLNKSYLIKTDTSYKFDPFSVTIRVIFILITLVFGLYLAFARHNEITADKFWLKKIKFMLRKKVFIYRR